MARSTRPLRHRSFRILWSATALSAAGDAVVQLARIVAVLQVTGSASALGIVFACGMLPNLVFLLAGGVIGDRLPRHRVMICSDIARAFVQAAVAYALFAGFADLWLLAGAAAAYGTANAFFTPAGRGLVPSTVPLEDLTQANGLMQVTRFGLSIGGPALAGAVIALSGPAWLFAFDAVSFAASAALLTRLRVDAPIQRGQDFFADLAAGWREVRARTWVWASIAYFAVWNFAQATVIVVGPLVAERSWGGAEKWAVVQIAMAVGAVAGSAIAAQSNPRRPLVSGYSALGVCAAVPVSLALGAPPLAVAVTAGVAFTGVWYSNALWYSVLGARIEQGKLSRVTSYDDLGSLIFMPLGFATGGALAGFAGTGPVLAVVTALFLVGTASILASSSVRSVGRIAEPEAPAAAAAAA